MGGAKFEDRVLRLSIPKPKQAQATKVKIGAGDHNKVLQANGEGE